ncbi:hypothetical protein E8E14_009445 [Neopestalotiopsis sp. 37M]|nr:hypothetical protein E8E14_009445 [Neopestalotiopsis sp. 37M]
MGDVYKHGLLNIAAASAMDSSGRLFEPQKPSSLQPDVVSMFMNGTQNQVLWYAHGKDSTVTNTIWDTWRSPLFQRAWVLQETLLASRAVVFTLDQVHFRCAEEISSGSMPADHPILQFDKLDKAFNREQRFIASMKFLSRENMVEAWREIVQRYSRTSITRIGDRLVAMSAIARHFSSLKQSPYHAGLWEDTFINDMAWFTCDPRRRDDIYVAPSWSWASLSEREDRQPSICPFPMNTGNQVQIAKVLEVRTKPSGQDEFGAVDSGWLKICAPLYYMGQKNEWELITTFKQRHGVLDADTFNARVFRDYLWEDDPVQPNIFALPLIAESFDSALEVRLILLIAVTPAKNLYKRVGFCLITRSFSKPNSYRQKCVELQVAQDLKEFLRRMERRDEDIHSHERMDNGWHTITII